MIYFLIDLAGAVALLLWAVRLIRTGVERAFMASLRQFLRRTAGTRISAMAAGTGAAMLLQSSTAVAILTAGFAASGTLAAISGVALVLGADLGSSIVAQILLSPIHVLVPALLVIGVTLFLKSKARRPRQAGRIFVGLALVLLSLGLIGEATAPLRESALVNAVLTRLGSDLVSAFVLGALLTWAMHSSIAAVLMFVTFAGQGLLPGPGAAAMVLGANLGGAIIPVMLTLSADPIPRRIMVSNFVLRGGGAMLVLLGLIFYPQALDFLGGTMARRVINLHLVFNLGVAILSLPLIPSVLRLAGAVVADRKEMSPTRISALDQKGLGDPGHALGNAARELLRMGESVFEMLQPALGLFVHWDPEIAARIKRTENEVDRMHYEIKLYVARLNETRLSTEQSRRAMEIAMVANHLEDAGDQISTNLVDLAQRIHERGLTFSEEGLRELTDFHDRVASNARVALNVLMSGEIDDARQLVEEKDRTRAAEAELQAAHLARLRANNSASIETTNIHQETVRALKQINTDMTYVAYPILEQAGDLRATRLTG
ncbi:hypothetical protein B6V73_06015 [Thioclava sp. JM3]|uniref:Na/Pi cotransporter family protein n=1 Tax=unclassified Thioclava TaxID=2621713 RepID=UPI000B53D3C9|nr:MULTISPECIES: Na/Pi cotransporter family protein [unclassified Thioclava]OWY01639.1 hypothetical protein B6V75_13705 [Thioclava sp. F1Mire-8]OWY14792.1 hypothetical protein B6V72_06005 [Thioclava sp. F34-6]OWY17237.1 hypothetical protein B6V73_06015 [Thioclava sp. JM3]PWE51420.1 Na/Pi cotransporter family protein [Thioclava sp. NG1]